jgi:hypothetical protein
VVTLRIRADAPDGLMSRDPVWLKFKFTLSSVQGARCVSELKSLKEVMLTLVIGRLTIVICLMVVIEQCRTIPPYQFRIYLV